MNTTGPLFNDKKRNFSPINSLGIESITTSMSDSLCPIINLVTRKPFYWMLRCWCYYDLLENKKGRNINNKDIDNYYKRINYFLCLGSMLAGVRENGGFVGSNFISNLIYGNPNKKSFGYEDKYITTMTQLNYYKNGLELLKIVNETETENGATRLYLYKSGEELAKAFDAKMRKTSFYGYRFKNTNIPRDVLIDLGNKIKIDLDGFDGCKTLFSRILFENKLTNIINKTEDNKNYVSFISNDVDLDLNNSANNRYLLFEYYPTRGLNRHIPENLKQVSVGWEIIVGRQYYSCGLEIIWKYLLNILNTPLSINEWINRAIESSKFSFSVKDKLMTVKDNYLFNFSEYEDIFAKERKESDENSIENGLKFILAMYNRFKDRNDYPDKYISMFERDSESTSSLYGLEEEINKYADKPIEEYLIHVMKSQLIYQHLITAFNKLPNIDGYFIVENEGKYIKVEDYELKFNELRTSTVYSVIKDLGLI